MILETKTVRDCMKFVDVFKGKDNLISLTPFPGGVVKVYGGDDNAWAQAFTTRLDISSTPQICYTVYKKDLKIVLKNLREDRLRICSWVLKDVFRLEELDCDDACSAFTEIIRTNKYEHKIPTYNLSDGFVIESLLDFAVAIEAAVDSTEDMFSRYALNHIEMSFDKKNIKVVGSTGHKLMITRLGGNYNPPRVISSYINKDSARALSVWLKRLSKIGVKSMKCYITPKQKHMLHFVVESKIYAVFHLKTENTVSFPPYKKVVNFETNKEVVSCTLNLCEFRKQIRKASDWVKLSGDICRIDLQLEKKSCGFEIRSSPRFILEYKSFMPYEKRKGNTENTIIRFDPCLLHSILMKIKGDNVIMKFNGSDKKMVLTSHEGNVKYKAILMLRNRD